MMPLLSLVAVMGLPSKERQVVEFTIPAGIAARIAANNGSFVTSQKSTRMRVNDVTIQLANGCTLVVRGKPVVISRRKDGSQVFRMQPDESIGGLRAENARLTAEITRLHNERERIRQMASELRKANRDLSLNP